MSLAMSREQRETFLAATRIGIVSIAEPERGPVTVPVWYRYDPGGSLRFTTGKSSHKAKVLGGVSRISLCVQTEAPPYSYVSVEGPATTGPSRYEDVEEMALRYLGPEMGAAYLQMTHPDRNVDGNIEVVLTPERWWSVDYGKM